MAQVQSLIWELLHAVDIAKKKKKKIRWALMGKYRLSRGYGGSLLRREDFLQVLALKRKMSRS